MRGLANRQSTVTSTEDLSPSIGAVDDLPARIHAATRGPHTNLNRLITARLPLCLPPHASTPQLYAFGISRFAEVYFAFEQAWIAQVSGGVRHGSRSRANTGDDDEYDILDSFINDGGGRIKSILRQIYAPELLRSDRLRSDILALKAAADGRSNNHHQPVPDGGKGNTTKDGERKHSKHENAATAFATHIKTVTAEHPHLILAYTWIMYMALFNGGRWIRSKLLEGGVDFWDPPHPDERDDSSSSSDKEAAKISSTHLSFWAFASNEQHTSDNDNESAETIKSTFHRRFLAAEMLLTEVERNQILDEAVEIFHRSAQIICDIDLEVARGAFRDSRRGLPHSSSSSSSSGSSNSSNTLTPGGIPSITIQSPSSSSLASSSQRSHATVRQIQPQLQQQANYPRRVLFNPLVAGAAGLLGGLCAWFWRANSEAVQWGYRALVGE